MKKVLEEVLYVVCWSVYLLFIIAANILLLPWVIYEVVMDERHRDPRCR